MSPQDSKQCMRHSTVRLSRLHICGSGRRRSRYRSRRARLLHRGRYGATSPVMQSDFPKTMRLADRPCNRRVRLQVHRV